MYELVEKLFLSLSIENVQRKARQTKHYNTTTQRSTSKYLANNEFRMTILHFSQDDLPRRHGDLEWPSATTKTNIEHRTLNFEHRIIERAFSRSQTPVWERHFTKLRFALILDSLYLKQFVKQSFRKMRYEAGAS